MDDFEKRLSKLEKEIDSIKDVLSLLAPGTAEALKGVEAELIYIKSHLGLTEAAPALSKRR